jgi:hypothetical protein
MRLATAVAAVLALAIACSGDRPAPAFRPETISVPGGAAVISTPVTRRVADQNLSATEGRFEIEAPTQSHVGEVATAWIRIFPAAGFHINTSYPLIVSLAMSDGGVRVQKLQLDAADAERLDERGLSIPIAITPTSLGDHKVTGSIHFGICNDGACLSRAMPLDVSIVAS